jgi:hypothetical protein
MGRPRSARLFFSLLPRLYFLPILTWFEGYSSALRHREKRTDYKRNYGDVFWKRWCVLLEVGAEKNWRGEKNDLLPGCRECVRRLTDLSVKSFVFFVFNENPVDSDYISVINTMSGVFVVRRVIRNSFVTSPSVLDSKENSLESQSCLFSDLSFVAWFFCACPGIPGQYRGPCHGFQRSQCSAG